MRQITLIKENSNQLVFWKFIHFLKEFLPFVLYEHSTAFFHVKILTGVIIKASAAQCQY
jgi:hypothetical protein